MIRDSTKRSARRCRIRCFKAPRTAISTWASGRGRSLRFAAFGRTSSIRIRSLANIGAAPARWPTASTSSSTPSTARSPSSPLGSALRSNARTVYGCVHHLLAAQRRLHRPARTGLAFGDHPNGIEVEPAPTDDERQRARAALGASPDVVVIGVVASLQPKKNQRLAIEAFARLPRRRRARLDLFGAGAEEPALRQLAAQLGVADDVTFWGFRSDVRALLPGLDVFLSVATVEAAPISLLEAMSACLPILGTPHIGTLDFVEDRVTGLVIPDWSVASVAGALDVAVTDRAWRTAAGTAGRHRVVADFDIERVADRHVRLYEELRATPCASVSPVSRRRSRSYGSSPGTR